MPTITTDNAFIDIETADALIDEMYGIDDWADVSDDDKARLIITATTDLKAVIKPETLSDDAIWTSDALEKATALQVVFRLRNNDAIESAMEDRVGNIISSGVGRLSKGKSGSSFNMLQAIHPQAITLLRGYIKTSATIVRA